jgi:hypothetical protein
MYFSPAAAPNAAALAAALPAGPAWAAVCAQEPSGPSFHHSIISDADVDSASNVGNPLETGAGAMS